MRHIAYLLTSLIFLLCISGCVQEAEQHPNIVYILADDMGFGDVVLPEP